MKLVRFLVVTSALTTVIIVLDTILLPEEPDRRR
jgi:hypothetical protein